MWQAFFKADFDLYFFSRQKLTEHIISQLLEPIRHHRDQKGDDRCWFDDFTLYWHLPESVKRPVKLSQSQMKDYCAYFHQCRGGNETPSAQRQNNNDYLQLMSMSQLRQEAIKLRKAIRKHRDMGMMQRMLLHDKELYASLPDGIEADFRLPPRELFLPNCALICGMQNSNNVDLSKWPDGQVSPLVNWRP
jgi:hypothetical protein